MPFAVLVVGILLVVVAIRGTQKEFATLFASEFSGKSNFFYWCVSIAIIGGLGYIPGLRKISDSFMLLLVLVLFLSLGQGGRPGGFFTKFQEAIQ
jgi:hypothetical protein